MTSMLKNLYIDKLDDILINMTIHTIKKNQTYWLPKFKRSKI